MLPGRLHGGLSQQLRGSADERRGDDLHHPGILCLVPGSAIFNTMLQLLEEDFTEFGLAGLQTLLMAGAIALGLLTIGAVLRVIYALVRKTVDLSELLAESSRMRDRANRRR